VDRVDGVKQTALAGLHFTRPRFRPSDIVILSMRGPSRATFGREKRIGKFTLKRPTGKYDLLGNQVLENGQLHFDTVYRFKGEQAPAIILTDVDFDEDRVEHAQRLLFTGMTRAMDHLAIQLSPVPRAAWTAGANEARQSTAYALSAAHAPRAAERPLCLRYL
jgi:hypothetical protein